MGILRNLFKADTRNRVDELAEKYVPKNDIPQLCSELDALRLKALSRDEEEAWYHVRGALEYSRKNHSSAMKYFEEGLVTFPDSAVLNFSTGQEHEREGRMDVAAPYFNKVKLGKSAGANYVMATARYLYLWNKIGDAQNMIQPFFDAYRELKIVDDTFLHLRGLPFYGEAFACRAVFAKLTGSLDLARDEIQYAKANMKDYNFISLEREMEALFSGDWQEVIKNINFDLQKKNTLVFSNYFLLQKAVHEAHANQTTAEAEVALDRINFTPQDFKWLEDIRLLAKCEMASRTGMRQKETELLTQFFEKQPLLFEPNHCFYFNFVDYQEILKREYQRKRQDGRA